MVQIQLFDDPPHALKVKIGQNESLQDYHTLQPLKLPKGL